MRVAVTGARGRLGRALITALEESPATGPGGPIPWTRAEFDLDDPGRPGERLDRDRVEAIIHAAAWTDVDGCARDPSLALRRNADAVDALARAAAERSIHFILVSTNEVFDGARTDGRGYRPDDDVSPPNPYGASKLAGERVARAAYEAGTGDLDIVRTSWLFGPGAPDFPTKILAAAERARHDGAPLRVVADEWSSPTYVADLAEGIVDLVVSRSPGPAATHHVVNAGVASRADWAREVLRLGGVTDVATMDVPSTTWPRPSTPPRWGVLEPSELPGGEPLRDWRGAMADYAPVLRRAVAAASAAR
jgi:dTDP-4-dehydrorhamnose reductase